MNENEMKNATIADIDEVTTPVAAAEDAAAPIQEPAAQDETNTAEAVSLAPEAVPAPADDGMDEEDEDVPAAQELSRNARRFNDDDLEIGDFIDDGNDMLKVDKTAVPETLRRCAAACSITSVRRAASCRAESLACVRSVPAVQSLRLLAARCAS